MTTLYLASGSPRRRELLAQIGVPFVSLMTSVDETPLPDEGPAAYVERLALAKAAAGLATLGSDAQAVVLGADTTVVLDGRILGKPASREACIGMLQSLGGREHEVFTAVALANVERTAVRTVCTWVGFRPVGAAEAAAYWDTGEPADKAGGYAIQGLAAVFVHHLQGSYSAVVGLPLCETAQLLTEFGIPFWQPM